MAPTANGGSAHQKQALPVKAPTPPTTADINGVPSHEEAVETAIKLFADIASKLDGRPLRSLLTDNDELRKQVDKQRAAKEVLQEDLTVLKQSERAKASEMEALHRSQQSSAGELNKLREDLEESKKEQNRLSQDYGAQTSILKVRETSLVTAVATTRKAESNLERSESDRELLAAELKTVIAQRDELKSLVSFGVQLKPVGSLRNGLSASLGRILEKAEAALDDLIFKHNMENSSDSQSTWVAFKSMDKVDETEIPLPRSDSIPARRMRFAAALKILAHILADNIFQPVYLSEDNDWVEESLRVLSKKNEAQETHLRSMLLALNPKAQQSMAAERVNQACDEARDVLQHIVPAGRLRDLNECLQDICGDAQKTWVQIQRVKENITFDFDVTTESEWEIRLLPESQTPSDSRPLEPGAGNSVRRKASSGALQLKEGVECISVWPAFASHNWLLCKGYTLTGAQLAKARQELDEEAEEDERLKREAAEALKKKQQERCNSRKVTGGSGRRGSQA